MPIMSVVNFISKTIIKSLCKTRKKHRLTQGENHSKYNTTQEKKWSKVLKKSFHALSEKIYFLYHSIKV